MADMDDTPLSAGQQQFAKLLGGLLAEVWMKEQRESLASSDAGHGGAKANIRIEQVLDPDAWSEAFGKWFCMNEDTGKFLHRDGSWRCQAADPSLGYFGGYFDSQKDCESTLRGRQH